MRSIVEVQMSCHPPIFISSLEQIWKKKIHLILIDVAKVGVEIGQQRPPVWDEELIILIKEKRRPFVHQRVDLFQHSLGDGLYHNAVQSWLKQS